MLTPYSASWQLGCWALQPWGPRAKPCLAPSPHRLHFLRWVSSLPFSSWVFFHSLGHSPHCLGVWKYICRQRDPPQEEMPASFQAGLTSRLRYCDGCHCDGGAGGAASAWAPPTSRACQASAPAQPSSPGWQEMAWLGIGQGCTSQCRSHDM